MREAYITRFLNHSNLVGYWRFEGNANDEKGSYNLTPVGSPSNAAGKFGNAYDFNGSSQYLDGGDVLDFERTSPFSLAAWVKSDDLGASRTIISKLNDSSNSGYLLYQIATGKIRFIIGNGSGGLIQVDTTSQVLLSTGVWYHVMITYSGSSAASGVKIYVNGIAVATTTVSDSLSSGSSLNSISFNIGATNDGAFAYWDGMIDDAMVFDAEISALQVYELAKKDEAVDDGVRGRIARFFRGDQALRGAWFPKLRPPLELNDTPFKSDANVKAYWRGEDLTDSSGNSKTLTDHGTVPFNAGKFSNAFDFGASNTTKYLDRADNLGIDGGVITMAAWFNITTLPSGLHNAGNAGVILVKSTVNSPYITYVMAYENNSGTYRLTFIRIRNNVAEDAATFNITVNTGVWYHAALTYDGTTIRGYLNGRLVASAAVSGNGTSSGAVDIVAISRGYNSTTNKLSGLVDDAIIFNRVLSTKEIASMVGEQFKDWSGWNFDGEQIGNIQNTKGIFGLAKKFNGSTDYISLGDIDITAAITVMGWFNVSGTTQQRLISKGHTADAEPYNLYALVFQEQTGPPAYHQAVSFEVGIGGTRSRATTPDYAVPNNRWNFICGTYDGSTVKIYVNGILQASTAASGSIDTNNKVVEIGRLNAGTVGNYMTGYAGETAILDRAISAQEIAQYYAWATSAVPFDDIFAATIVLVSVADSGSGSDAQSILAAIAAADTGSGTDAFANLLAQISQSEAGSGADVISILAQIALSDTATSNDAIAVLVALALSDNGSAADAISILAQIAASDNGSAVDAIVQILAAISASDSGSASDAISLLVALAIAESGSGIDAISIFRMIDAADTGSGLDAVGVLNLVAQSDSGVAADAISLLAQLIIADAGAGSENALINAILNLSDAGSAVDAANALVLVAKSDSGLADDAIEAIQTVLQSDIGSGSEAVSILGRAYPYLKRSSPYKKMS